MALRPCSDQIIRWSLGMLLDCQVVHCLPGGDTVALPSCYGCKGNLAVNPLTDGRVGGWPASNASRGNQALLQAIPPGGK